MVHAETTAGPNIAFAILCEANDIVIRTVFDTAGNLIGFGIYTEKAVMICAEPQVFILVEEHVDSISPRKLIGQVEMAYR